jgi:hypothetical protein
VEQGLECRQCGTGLTLMPGSEARHLAGAVRERFARDARLGAQRPRFIRDPGPQRLTD